MSQGHISSKRLSLFCFKPLAYSNPGTDLVTGVAPSSGSWPMTGARPGFCCLFCCVRSSSLQKGKWRRFSLCDDSCLISCACLCVRRPHPVSHNLSLYNPLLTGVFDSRRGRTRIRRSSSKRSLLLLKQTAVTRKPVNHIHVSTPFDILSPINSCPPKQQFSHPDFPSNSPSTPVCAQ